MQEVTKLVLTDGTTFEGKSFALRRGRSGLAQDDMRGNDMAGEGEVVFNTGMVGYPESLTDPSYRGQILVFTYPLIGNYGVPSEELNEYGFSKNFESEDIQVRGVICSQVSDEHSHFAAEKSLSDWMEKHGIPGITGVDTRALTKKLREHGVILGRIEQDNGLRTKDMGEIEDPNLRNLVAEVSCDEVHRYEPNEQLTINNEQLRKTIVVYDCGIKRNILRSFLKRGVTIVRVPWNFDLSSADFKYDGVFISNGPGDPKMCKETIASTKWAIEKGIPTFGICLGNQILALAIGGDTYKLKYGHRGANQPCLEITNHQSSITNESPNPKSQKCIITSQNHGFAVSDELPQGWKVWWKNANDGTVEGVRHESGKFFSVQFHPESTPGPEDANYLFDEFLDVIKTSKMVMS
jgi:carbamoyl-phosphate synthase small subunit